MGNRSTFGSYQLYSGSPNSKGSNPMSNKTGAAYPAPAKETPKTPKTPKTAAVVESVEENASDS